MTVAIARRVRVPMSDAEVQEIIRHVIARPQPKQSRPTRTKRRTPSTGIASPRLPVGARNDTLSVAFIGPTRMRELNRMYRGEDRVTDVLAFPDEVPPLRVRGGKGELSSDRNPSQPPLTLRGGECLGELVICPSYVKRSAARAGEPFMRELTRVLIHGTLHLLGYDHATTRQAERMFALQEAIVRLVSLRGRSRSNPGP